MYNQQRLKKVALMLMMSMLCLISFAQERQVQGIVKDKSGEPMIGVNVLVKGTTNGRRFYAFGREKVRYPLFYLYRL